MNINLLCFFDNKSLIAIHLQNDLWQILASFFQSLPIEEKDTLRERMMALFLNWRKTLHEKTRPTISLICLSSRASSLPTEPLFAPASLLRSCVDGVKVLISPGSIINSFSCSQDGELGVERNGSLVIH